MGALRNTHRSLFGGWGGPSLIDDGPAYPKPPRRTGRTLRLALEKALVAVGIPKRRGRRPEHQYHRREEKDHRRREETERRRPGAHRQRQANGRSLLARLGKEPRVIVLAVCNLPSCKRRHSQRRPRWQTTGLPGERGAYTLLQSWPAYCSTRHRLRAWWERQRALPIWRTCEWCGRRILAQPMQIEGDRFFPRRGRPRRFCDATCRQQAYRQAHPAAPAPIAFYDTPCRSCGERIAASGRPGRPPTRCAGCRVTAPTTSVIPVQAGIQEIEAQRRRALSDPEYAAWLRARGEMP